MEKYFQDMVDEINETCDEIQQMEIAISILVNLNDWFKIYVDNDEEIKDIKAIDNIIAKLQKIVDKNMKEGLKNELQ